jgi:hypothetical protein
MRRLLILSLLLTTVLRLGVSAESDFRLYQIGNSHTFDSLPRDGLPALFESAGFNLINGWHIRCARSLNYITQHPDSVCVESNNFGKWIPALANHSWCAIVLQTHNGSTGNEELNAISTILAPVADLRNTQVYVYVNWPRIQGREFRDVWGSGYSGGEQRVVQSASYFQWLAHELKSNHRLAEEISFIPVGNVLSELDRRFREGEFVGFNKVDDLYRDDVHMSNVGKYVVGLTIMATLLDYDIRLLGAPPKPYGRPTSNFRVITPELADYLQQVVWAVVSNLPSGLGTRVSGVKKSK